MSVDAAPGDTRQPLVIEGLAGLRERVGTVLGVSDWVETTQENVDTFAKLTGDEQYIHVDPERAAKGPFGTTVQHGFLTLGTATGLLWSVCVVEGFNVILNYGLNKVRFPAPLKVGSRSRMHVELIEVNEVEGRRRSRLSPEVRGRELAEAVLCRRPGLSLLHLTAFVRSGSTLQKNETVTESKDDSYGEARNRRHCNRKRNRNELSRGWFR